MTQLTQTAVAEALDAFLQGIGSLGGDINTEGSAYRPLAGVPYLSARLSAYTRTPAGIGPNAPYQANGSYQIRVNRPGIGGLHQARAIAARLVALFSRGTPITLASGQVLTIESSTEQPEIPGGDWLSVPVIVTWYVSE